MARPRKVVEIEATSDEKKIKILSFRRGDIQLPDGVTIKHQEVCLVTEDQAQYLEKCFKGELKRL